MSAAAFVFHCTSETEDECIRLNLLGMPDTAANRRATARIGPDTAVYLFNTATRELMGRFRARGAPGLAHERGAWRGRFA